RLGADRPLARLQLHSIHLFQPRRARPRPSLRKRPKATCQLTFERLRLVARWPLARLQLVKLKRARPRPSERERPPPALRLLGRRPRLVGGRALARLLLPGRALGRRRRHRIASCRPRLLGRLPRVVAAWA